MTTRLIIENNHEQTNALKACDKFSWQTAVRKIMFNITAKRSAVRCMFLLLISTAYEFDIKTLFCFFAVASPHQPTTRTISAVPCNFCPLGTTGSAWTIYGDGVTSFKFQIFFQDNLHLNNKVLYWHV